MWPRLGNLCSLAIGSAGTRRRATPCAATVEAPPLMISTGIRSVANTATRCRLGEQCVRPVPDVLDRGGDRWLAVLRGGTPRAGTHPVVDEPLGCSGALAPVERGDRIGDRMANAVRFVRRRGFGIDEGEERWLVEREGAHPLRIRECGDQRHGRTIRVADQAERRSGAGEHGIEELDLILQGHQPIQRPLRTAPRTVAVRRQHAVGWRQQVHQGAPLARRAGVRVDADDGRAGAGLSNEWFSLGHGRDCVVDSTAPDATTVSRA